MYIKGHDKGYVIINPNIITMMKTIDNALQILQPIPGEQFKEIKGFDNYWISNHGRVLSWKHNAPTFLTASKDREGYLHVRLYRKGTEQATLFKVHRLVALNFLKPNPDRPTVNHKDGDKQNNHVNNLEWLTHYENLLHGRMNGFITTKSKKVTVIFNDTTEITFKSIAEAANALQVSKSTIKDYSDREYIATELLKDVEKIILHFN